MKRSIKKQKLKVEGKRLKIGIVVSKFNIDITQPMLEGALDVLKENKVKDVNIKIIWVPGSFEIPLVCQRLAISKKYDALIAIGCVIKGQTDHFYYIAGEASRGVMKTMLKYSIPIGFGVLTTLNLTQAKARCGKKENKGREAAEAALEMASGK